MRKTYFWLWLARRIPKRLRYWSMIVEAADFAERHPQAEVPSITVLEVLG